MARTNKDAAVEGSVQVQTEPKKTEIKFSYSVLLQKYPRHRVLLSVILDKSREYSTKEVDDILATALKREVK